MAKIGDVGLSRLMVAAPPSAGNLIGSFATNAPSTIQDSKLVVGAGGGGQP